MLSMISITAIFDSPWFRYLVDIICDEGHNVSELICGCSCIYCAYSEVDGYLSHLANMWVTI